MRTRLMSWVDQASCIGIPVEIFYPDTRRSYAEARQICQSCPVRTECLTYAMDAERPISGRGFAVQHRHGMWGGMTPDERSILAMRERMNTGASVLPMNDGSNASDM